MICPVIQNEDQGDKNNEQEVEKEGEREKSMANEDSDKNICPWQAA